MHCWTHCQIIGALSHNYQFYVKELLSASDWKGVSREIFHSCYHLKKATTIPIRLVIKTTSTSESLPILFNTAGFSLNSPADGVILGNVRAQDQHFGFKLEEYLLQVVRVWKERKTMHVVEELKLKQRTEPPIVHFVCFSWGNIIRFSCYVCGSRTWM